MSDIKLFILEDDAKQEKLYRDAIGEFNKSKGVNIVIEYSNNLEDAIEKLRKGVFDAAIIDLKLGRQDTEGKGNRAIKEIRENLRFPVFVMSGFIDELDQDLREENVFYKTYVNTSKSIAELLEEILELYNTGITNILGKKGKIEHALQDVFWKHIASNMGYWRAGMKSPDENERILLRHTLSYLSGYLEMDDKGTFLYFDPAEVYIIPPIIKQLFTGDILKHKVNGELHIVLTPACDFSQNKAKNVALALIEKMDMEYLAQEKRKFIENGAASEEGKKAQETIKELLRNSHSHKYHFLPPTEQFRGGFINFQKVSSIKIADASSYDRIASVTEKFMKDVIARFSHYYARQGQPDLDIDGLFTKITT